MKNEEKQAQIIGARIKAAREDAGYPQSLLAEKLGFESATAISLIEKGARNISTEKLEKIAKILRKDIHYFFGTKREKTTDVLTALRADPDFKKQDREVLEQIIKSVKARRHAGRNS